MGKLKYVMIVVWESSFTSRPTIHLINEPLMDSMKHYRRNGKEYIEKIISDKISQKL